MNPQQLAEAVAREIFPAGSSLLLIVLILLAAIVGSFAGKYLETKGQNLATKEDFEGLKAQLADSTHLVEEIKTKFARSDWASREWTTLRIKKIEELVKLLSTIPNQLEDAFASGVRGDAFPDWENIRDAGVITLLYLPELNNDLNAIGESIWHLRMRYLTLGEAAPQIERARLEYFTKKRLDEQVDRDIVRLTNRVKIGAANLLQREIAERPA